MLTQTQATTESGSDGSHRWTASSPRGNADDARCRDEIDLLIVDDHRAARYSVWALLSWKRDMRVTGTASSSAEALTLVKRRRPHVCLISAALGQGEALTLASRMKHLIDPPRVLIFADAVDQRLACAATVAGADGILCRYADPEEQAGIVRRVASGEQQFPRLQPAEIHALLGQVEDRDRAIVAMLLEHTPSDHIAGLLGISARSLALRRQNILKRLEPSCGVDERLKDGLAEGAQRPDLSDGEHPELSSPTESRPETQTSPASGHRSRAGLGSAAPLGKRLTMSQPSRHTTDQLRSSEIAIVGLLGSGLLSVVALCVAIAL